MTSAQICIMIAILFQPIRKENLFYRLYQLVHNYPLCTDLSTDRMCKG